MGRVIKLSPRRKDLKKDEFVSLLAKGVEFIRQWSRIIIAGSISAVIIILIFLIIRDQKLKSEIRSEEEFRKAITLFEESKGDQKKISEAEGLFKKIVSNYGKTLYGGISYIYLGNIYYEGKQWDRAIEAYDALLSSQWNKPPYNYIATESIAYCYEGKGDYAGALAWYKRLYEILPEKMKERALLSMARCYVKQGQDQLAEQIYREIAKSPEQTNYSKILLIKEFPVSGK